MAEIILRVPEWFLYVMAVPMILAGLASIAGIVLIYYQYRVASLKERRRKLEQDEIR